MDQSAQNVAAPDLRPGHDPRVQSGIGRLKVEASMRPGPVVVLDVGAEHALRVAPSEDDDVVETLPTNGAYPALRGRVRLRRPDGRPHYCQSFCSEDLVEASGELGVSMMTGQLRRAKARPTRGADLPTGLVTFLMTDIEYSTSILERLGWRYSALRDDVQATIRRAVRAAGGREVDARADEFFAVFELATSALEAAVAIQLALGGRTWPDGLECRVRIGVHSGRPNLTDAGYVGLPVHTAARVSSVAHGGQIVVSGETVRAIDGSVPAGIGLGRIGFEGRHDYAALGPVTNLASRLSTRAVSGQILIGQRVFAAVEKTVETVPAGRLELKGFRDPVAAYEVRRLR